MEDTIIMALKEVWLIVRNGFICLRIGLKAKAYEHGNESTCSVTIGYLLTS
jgi:hypothetical protein